MRRIRERLSAPQPAPPPPVSRLFSADSSVTAIRKLECGSLVVSWQDSSISVFTREEELPRSFGSGYDAVLSVEPLDKDMLLSVTETGHLRVLAGKGGERGTVGRVDFLAGVTSWCKLVGCRAVVAERDGMMHEVAWRRGKLIQGREFGTTDECSAMCSYGNKFVWFWSKGEAVVHNSVSLQEQKTIRLGEAATCAAMNEFWLVAGLPTKGIRVIDTNTWRRKKCAWATGIHAGDLTMVGKGGILVCTTESVGLYGVESGKLWSRAFNKVSAADVWRGRLVVGTKKGNVMAMGIDADALQKVDQEGSTDDRGKICSRGLMETALDMVLLSKTDGCKMCECVMGEGLCADTIEEWYCAHWLLTLTRLNKAVPAETSYDSIEDWWRKELYARIGDLSTQSDEETAAVQACIDEARRASLLSDESIAISQSPPSDSDLHPPSSRLRAVLLSSCERIFAQGDRPELFTETVKDYKLKPNFSVLFSLALQLVGRTVAQPPGHELRHADRKATCFNANGMPAPLCEVWRGEAECTDVTSFAKRVLQAAVETLERKVDYVADEKGTEIETRLSDHAMNREMLQKKFERELKAIEDEGVWKEEEKGVSELRKEVARLEKVLREMDIDTLGNLVERQGEEIEELKGKLEDVAVGGK